MVLCNPEQGGVRGPKYARFIAIARRAAWMIASLALALMLNTPVALPLAVHLSIDQAGGLSVLQLRLAVDEVQEIWNDVGVVVTSGPYGEPSRPDEATISLRILLSPAPGSGGTERRLAWVPATDNGRTAPLLLVSLPAVTEVVMGADALGRSRN